MNTLHMLRKVRWQDRQAILCNWYKTQWRRPLKNFRELRNGLFLQLMCMRYDFRRSLDGAWLTTPVQTEHPRKVLKDELRRSESREFGVLLTVAGGENVVPRGDACLFVELSMPFSPLLCQQLPTSSQGHVHISSSSMLCSGKIRARILPSSELE